tara:strand:- start:6965 stop:7957 length:993 start_codon:yes stop_codon:yes gene_type:complete
MNKILAKLKKFFSFKDLINEDVSFAFNEKFSNFLSYLLPENFNEIKKSFLLFWFIASFTLIFLIWAYFAEVNQVVRASGSVRPDSKVHLVQTAMPGPVESIKVSLGDKVKSGDILFIIDNKRAKQLYQLSKTEVETRARKVGIIEELVNKGSDSEFRLLDERLSLIEAQKRFDQAELKLQYSYIKAPISGSVSQVNATNIGQIVKDGALLAEIVPENDILKIEAGLASKDIAYVKVGQKARISFTAFDMAIYGQVDGTVTKVAANTSQNEDGVSFYPIIIEVDSQLIKERNDIIIQSGMQCDVSIIGEKRTVLSYIANPITKLSMKALQE